MANLSTMKSLEQQLSNPHNNIPYVFMYSEEQKAICDMFDDIEGHKAPTISINGQIYTECFHVFSNRLQEYKKSFPDSRLVFVGNFDTIKRVYD